MCIRDRIHHFHFVPIPLCLSTSSQPRCFDMPVMQSRQLTWLRIGLALLAGSAHAASLAWPFSLQISLLLQLGLRRGQPVWWLQLVALGSLAWLLECGLNMDCGSCKRG